jgi:cation transport ATPase
MEKVPCAQAACCTCVMVAVSGRLVAVLAVTDPLKPEARGVVRSLPCASS